jgi:hypothetical protein
MDGDERGAIPEPLKSQNGSGLVWAHEKQAVVVDTGDAQAVKPTGAAEEVPVECGVLGKQDDR